MPFPSQGPAPLPPDVAGGVAPQPGPGPSMMQLAGMQMGQASMAPTSGMSQINEAAVRMGAEIDQALKLLAQSIPQLAPWVEKTTLELRYQLGTALQSGAAPTNPTPQDSDRFPTGESRL